MSEDFKQKSGRYVMHEITERIVTENDKEFCKHVHHTVYKDAVVRQFGEWDSTLQATFFEQIWNKSPLRILSFQGQSVGVLSRIEHADHIFLCELQLLPEYQGQGIGTLLLRKEMQRAASAHVPLRLQVLHKNRAQNLYRRLGFYEIRRSETHIYMEWISSD